MHDLLFWIPLSLLILIALFLLLRGTQGELLTKFACFAQQVLRRWSWFYLFVGGLLLYPLQVSWQLHEAARGLLTAQDKLDAAAQVLAKVVDPQQVYSKNFNSTQSD